MHGNPMWNKTLTTMRHRKRHRRIPARNLRHTHGMGLHRRQYARTRPVRPRRHRLSGRTGRQPDCRLCPTTPHHTALPVGRSLPGATQAALAAADQRRMGALPFRSDRSRHPGQTYARPMVVAHCSGSGSPQPCMDPCTRRDPTHLRLTQRSRAPAATRRLHRETRRRLHGHRRRTYLRMLDRHATQTRTWRSRERRGDSPRMAKHRVERTNPPRMSHPRPMRGEHSIHKGHKRHSPRHLQIRPCGTPPNRWTMKRERRTDRQRRTPATAHDTDHHAPRQTSRRRRTESTTRRNPIRKTKGENEPISRVQG